MHFQIGIFNSPRYDIVVILRYTISPNVTDDVPAEKFLRG